MKIALATTTIHVPHALKLMRKCSRDVRFFVAIDEKTPEEAVNFCAYDLGVGNTHIVYLDASQRWKCADAIGLNTIARRNLAFLEALKWGADVIYSWDDDNIPVDLDHLDHAQGILSGMLYDGPCVSGPYHSWFDPGSLLIPSTRHRGFPHDKRSDRTITTVTDVRIGVAAGLIVGNPDVDASTRMELKPDIAQTHILGQTGVVVNPRTRTVFNTQNTAVIRDLVPAWFLMPGVGRMDDIYASLIVQHVARERGYHVHFGPPICYQQRHEHNLVTDLRAEIDGYENVTRLAVLLDSIIIPHGWTVVDDVRRIYDVLLHCDFLPRASVEAGLLWLEDCRGVI